MTDEQGAYDRLRAHLIAEHGYADDYFDEDYPIGGPIRDLSTLRWLHAPHVKSREYPTGCDRDPQQNERAEDRVLTAVESSQSAAPQSPDGSVGGSDGT